MDLNFQKWRDFAKGKTVVKVIIDEYDIVNFSKDFTSHRDFIAHCFAQKGLEVTRWNHKYAENGDILEWGLAYMRADTDIRTIVEVCGIVGENLRGTTENVISNS